MVRSYIRIYGPPVQEAIDALEGVAVEMSKITSIKFSHGAIPYPERLQSKKTDWETFLKKMRDLYVDIYEPAKLISNSAYMLGEYDFFFEWDENPSRALDGSSCAHASLITKNWLKSTLIKIFKYHLIT